MKRTEFSKAVRHFLVLRGEAPFCSRLRLTAWKTCDLHYNPQYGGIRSTLVGQLHCLDNKEAVTVTLANVKEA